MSAERNTKQKQAIYNALVTLDHPSATEVFDYLRVRSGTISRGTVFRVLNVFAESGKVRRFNLLDGEAHYDYQTFPHAHARCKQCNRIFDVMLPDNLLHSVSMDDFRIEGCEIEFTGVCRSCFAKDETNSA